jgi:hypothetical protein
MLTTENQVSRWRQTEMNILLRDGYALSVSTKGNATAFKTNEVGTLFIHKEKNEGEKAVYHLSTPGENNSCTWTRHASVLLAMNTVHIGPVLTGAEPSFNPEPSPESLPKSTPVPAGWDSVDTTNEDEEEEVHMTLLFTVSLSSLFSHALDASCRVYSDGAVRVTLGVKVPGPWGNPGDDVNFPVHSGKVYSDTYEGLEYFFSDTRIICHTFIGTLAKEIAIQVRGGANLC